MKSLQAAQTCEKLDKPVLVTPAHCKKESVLISCDNSSQLWEKIEKKNGHGNSLRKEKWPG
jgi:hypothetical protein